MKKVIAMALVFILAFTCIPAASAANYTEFAAGTTTLEVGDNFGNVTIKSDSVVVIPAGVNAVITADSTVIVNGTLINNGTITNNGTLIVNSTLQNNAGVIENNGVIRNKSNIYCGENGVIKTLVVVPDTSVADEAHPYHVRVASNITTEDEFFAKPEDFYGAANAGTRTYVLDGESLYFTINFEKEKIDPDKFVVNANGVRVFRDRGAYKITPDGEAITVSYGDYVEKNLIKKIKIILPYGEGYRVVAYGTTLEEATEENIEYIYVDYGSSVSFRVDVFEGWQNSDVTLTIGGLDPSAQADGSAISGPDQYGYYTIRDITDKKAASGVYDIYVAGVVKDDTQNLIMTIFNTIRRVFETIQDIFNTLFGGIFSGIGGNNTTTPAAPTGPVIVPEVTESDINS